MKSRTIGLLAIFAIVLFVAVSLRSYPVGVDSYNYLAFIRDHDNVLVGKNFVVETFFSLFPKDIWFWNAMACLFVFLNTFMISKIGEFLNPKTGEYAGLFAYAGLFFVLNILQFEPIAIGLFFLFWATLEHLKSPSGEGPFVYILWIIGGIFWPGALFFAWFFAFRSIVFRLIAVGASIIFIENILAALMPNFGVYENVPIAGGLILVFFVIAFYQNDLKKMIDLRFDRRMAPFLILSLIMASLSFKYTILAIPLFAINLAWRIEPEYVNYMAIFSGITFLMLVGLTPILYPTNQMMDATAYGISLSDRGRVQNDWGLGHFVAFEGGTPSLRYGPKHAAGLFGSDLNYLYDFDCDDRPIVTALDLNSDFNRVYDNNAYKVYKCLNTRKVV